MADEGLEILSEKLTVISETTDRLLEIIADLRTVTMSRLDDMEAQLNNTKRQQQQSIILLAELADR